MRCPRCGSEESGKFCSQCGAELAADGPRCAACGAGLEPGALFCSECGTPTGRRPRKPASAYLPWVLSALALVVFAVAIGIMIQGQASPRAQGMPPTGGVIAPQGEAAGDAAPAGAAAEGAMPDLSTMTPREAADRLFERSMRLEESGDVERARFFANMAVQAYDAVPPDGIDADARFHLGLLDLLQQDPDAAETQADAILTSDPDHLLGIMLRARVAEARGDAAAERAAYARFLDLMSAQRARELPEYGAHAGLLDAEAAKAREVTGG